MTRVLPIIPAAALMLSVAAAAAQTSQTSQFEVNKAFKSDVAPTLEELARGVAPAAPTVNRQVFLGRIPLPDATIADRADEALQTIPLPYSTLSPAHGTAFAGLGNGFPGFSLTSAPPDTNGSIGSTQYVQWVNTSFAVFDKSTGKVVSGGGPFAGNTLWSGFGGGCQTNNDGDPIVLFDKQAQRWIFTQFSVSTLPYTQCYAISQSSDARGPYFRFAFSYGNVQFPDYTKIGVWPTGYFVTHNIFNNGSTFAGAKVCAIDRAAALAGTTPTQICNQLSTAFGGLLPSDLDGSNPPPAGSPNYLVSFGTNSLNVWEFIPNFASPPASTFTGPTNLPVAAFTPACNGSTCIPQPSVRQKLDSLADRLMFRAAYRNRTSVGGAESIVLSHSVKSPTSASGIRWYELRISAMTPSVFQQGTFAPADTTSRWMPSIAMNKCGDIIVGYSASSTSVRPSIRATGRLSTDPVGTMQTEVNLVTGGGSQNGGLSRWGDYSAMSVDPATDSTMYYTNEFLKATGSFNWNTAVMPVKFTTCQ
jgi:hypothetical protein